MLIVDGESTWNTVKVFRAESIDHIGEGIFKILLGVSLDPVSYTHLDSKGQFFLIGKSAGEADRDLYWAFCESTDGEFLSR